LFQNGSCAAKDAEAEIKELHAKIGDHGAGFFIRQARSVEPKERKAMIDRADPMPIAQQCRLLGLSRSSVYYQAVPISEAELALMRRIDEIHLRLPFYGSRKIQDLLEREGYRVNRKKVQRLMGLMGISALYPKRRRTSLPAEGHRIYPYLLRDLTIDQPNQVWCADICYIPMARGFLDLVAIMDRDSHAKGVILSWRLSNTLDTHFCVEALDRYGTPEIFNTDEGAQFTSDDFTRVLQDRGIRISTDGKGRL
jgi:putative transposase